MCYVGRLKGSMYLVNGRLEAGSQNRCKNLANTRLDLRNAANSFQIEGKGGCYLETHPIPRGRKTGSYIYNIRTVYIYIHVMYIYIL